MKRVGYLALILGAVVLAIPQADAGVGFSIVGAGLYGKPNTTGISDTFSAKLGYGGGALVDLPVGGSLALEAGGLYLIRNYTDSTTASDVREKLIEIPVTLRMMLGQSFSIGVGGYYSTGLGDMTVGGVDATYASENLTSSDYGLTGSLRAAIPMGGGNSFIIDAGYLFGLKNRLTVNTTTASWKTSDIQAMIGVQFGGGGGGSYY